MSTTDLHGLCDSPTKLSLALTRTRTHPSEISRPDNSSLLPLHFLLNRPSPTNAVELIAFLTVVDALISGFPEGVVTASKGGWLPMHYGCFWKHPIAVLRKLVTVETRGLIFNALNNKGENPLDISIAKGFGDESVEIFLTSGGDSEEMLDVIVEESEAVGSEGSNITTPAADTTITPPLPPPLPHPTPLPFTLIVTLTFTSQTHKSTFDTLFPPLSNYIQTSEPSCLCYKLLQSDKYPLVYTLHERYRCKEDYLKVHRVSEEFLKFRGELKVMDDSGGVKVNGESYLDCVGGVQGGFMR